MCTFVGAGQMRSESGSVLGQLEDGEKGLEGARSNLGSKGAELLSRRAGGTAGRRVCRGHRKVNNLGTVDKRRQRLGSAFQRPFPNDNREAFTDSMFQAVGHSLTVSC